MASLHRARTATFRTALALALLGAAPGLITAKAAPDGDADRRPQVAGCYGGVVGVGTTSGCSFREGEALWFFAVSPWSGWRALDVTYRFDFATREMVALPIGDRRVPGPVRKAWEEFRDRSGRSPRGRIEPSEVSRPGDRRVYEIKERAILVREIPDYRLHVLPWPSWSEVEGWVGSVRRGLPITGKLEHLREMCGDRPPGGWLGPYAQMEGRLYFGLLGGFSEGEGDFGGLAIFDLDAESWKVLHPPQLLEATATGVLPDPKRRTLWIGAVHYGESGVWPASGLLRFDLRDRTWASFTTENSDIAGDIVWWMSQTSDALWVSTEAGLSRLAFADGSFLNFEWSPAPKGSQPAFDLKAVGSRAR